MSIIMGALGGAGEEFAKIGATNMKNDLDTERQIGVARVTSDLELQRQQTLEAFKATQRDAGLNRITAKAKDFANQDVPMEPAPVTSLSGNDPQASAGGPALPGFTGNIAEVRKSIAALPDGPDKERATARLQRQIDADTSFEGGIVAGRTRKRTAAEATDAAVQDAKANDMPAYADYESRIGKPLRDERRIDVAETKAEAAARQSATESERKAAADQRRDATQRYIAELRDETANRRLEALVSKMGGGSNGTKEALSFIDGARKELANDAATLKSMYAADIKDLGPTQRAKVKAEYESKFAAVEAKRSQIEADFNALREKVGLPASTAPAAPAPKPSEALPLPREKSAMQSGKVYQTSRGPAKWNGTAFEIQ